MSKLRGMSKSTEAPTLKFNMLPVQQNLLTVTVPVNVSSNNKGKKKKKVAALLPNVGSATKTIVLSSTCQKSLIAKPTQRINNSLSLCKLPLRAQE